MGPVLKALHVNFYLYDVGGKVVPLGEERRCLLLHPPHAVVGAHSHDKGLAVDYLPSGTGETVTQ